MIRNVSRARIAVLPAEFPTGSLPNAQNFSTSETSGEILGMKAENKVGNKAGKTAIVALESFLINEISYQTLSFIT